MPSAYISHKCHGLITVAQTHLLANIADHLNAIIALEGRQVNLLKELIEDQVKEILFNDIFPNVFIASAERTGVAIFRKDLDFARNRMLDELGAKRELDPFEFLDAG